MADDKPAFDPTKPFEPVQAKPAFDPNKPFEAAPAPAGPPASSQAGDFFKSIPRGAISGFAGTASAMGTAAAAEMGQPEMAETIPSPEQTANLLEKNVTGELHKPEGAAGKYGAAVGETLGNPATYLGPGGIFSKALMGTASALGSEAAGQAAEGTGWEIPARIAGGFAAGPLAGRAAKPQLAPAQQALVDAGVTQLTPGQLTGGMMKSVEDKLTSFPILGDFIQNARGRSVASFNKAVANQALEPIGESIARGVKPGHDMVKDVAGKLDAAYNNLVPNIHFIPDHDFAQDFARIKNDTNAMPRSAAKLFDKIVEDRLHPNRWVSQQLLPPNMPNPNNLPALFNQPIWGLQGKQFKSIESELTRLAGVYGSSADAGHQLLGGALGDLVKSMRSNLERVNPAHSAELANINKGWAMYSRIRDAAGSPTGAGIFTPAQLLGAVKRGDKSVGKGSFAKGDALMQDFAEAGQKVLPSKVPDSGTAGRTLASVVAGGGLGYLNPKVLAAVGAASTPYLTPSMALLNRYVRPTTGARAAYANTGRGMVAAARPFLQAAPYGGDSSAGPYGEP